MKQARPRPRNEWPLLSVLLLAFVFLNFHLALRSFWVDELFTARIADFPPSRVLREVAADLHPPLYFLLIRLWAAVAGTGEFSLRWPSVCFALLGVSLLWKLGYRLGGRPVALSAALAMATSPLFVEFSRMARYYSLVLVLGLLSTLLFLRASKSGRLSEWLGYWVAATALLYTFYPAVSILLVHGFALFLQGRPRFRLREWFISISLAGLCFLPWATITAGQVSRAGGMIRADFAATLPGLFLSLAYPFYAFSVGETLFPWFPTALPAACAVLTLAGLGWFRSVGFFRKLLTLSVLIPVLFTALTITYVSTGTPFLNAPVRSLFVLPYFLLLVAGGWCSLTRPAWRMGLGALVGVTWVVGLVNMYTGQQYLNPNYIIPAREVARQISAQTGPGDVVIGEWDSGFSYYYQRIPHMGTYLETQPVSETIRSLTTIVPERVWLVTIGRDRTREVAPTELVHWLETNCTVVEEHGYVEQDPMYRWLKERLLHRPAYLYKLVVRRFECRRGESQ